MTTATTTIHLPAAIIELRTYEGRPGAMYAFALPSRRFDRRVYRDGRVEGVV